MDFKLLFVALAFFGLAQSVLLGVDLGDEFSKAILVAPNVQFDILLTPESKRKDPCGLSIVPGANNESVDRKYGMSALPQCSKNPLYCFFGAKSVVNGCSLADHKMYKSKFPGTDLAAIQETVPVFAISREKENQMFFYPEEVLGMQLREIKQRALDHWKEASPETFSKDGEITELVMSVPRYFNEHQRKGLKDAANLAGMEIISLVDDGVAIGIDFAQKSEIGTEKELFLVMDVGASATKATLIGLQNVNDTITLDTLGYGYDKRIGGQIFTKTVRDAIVKKFAKEHKLDPQTLFADAKLLRRTWQTAEKTKLVLSTNSESRVSIESFYNDIDLKQEITRAEIEKLVANDVKEYLKNVLDSALESIDKKQLKGIILAGGSFRVPIVQSTLSEYFGGDDLFLKSVNADESIVFGTTIRGASMRGLTRRQNVEIVDHDFNSHIIKYAEEPVTGGLASYPAFETIEKGAIANKQHLLNMTDSNGKYIKEFQVEVFTNQDLKPQYYNFTMPRRFDETSCEDYQYFMNYHYDETDSFSVNYMKLKCTKNGVAKTGNFLKQSNINGLSAVTRIALKEKLDKFDLYDEEQRNKTEVINRLESLTYETRYLLDENEDYMEVSHVENIHDGIAKTLEWIEDSAEEAQLEQIQKRVTQMEETIKIINAHVALKDWDSAMETLEGILGSIQEALDDTMRVVEKVDSNEAKLREEVRNKGLNYDVMVSRVAQSDRPSHDLLHNTKDFINEINEILEIVESVDSDGYKYLIKDGWIDSIISSTLSVSRLQSYKQYYKSTWDNRNGFLQHQLSEMRSEEEKQKRKLKRAQKQKELKQAIEMEKSVTKEETAEPTPEPASESETPVRDEL